MSETETEDRALMALAAEVRTEAELAALIKAGWQTAGVLDAVQILSPELERPVHLRAMANVFRRAEAAAHGDGPPVLALLSAPPQVGKSLTGAHAMSRWLARHPEDFLAYLTYGQDIASDKSKIIRVLSRSAGVELMTDTTAADLWRTTAGGGLLARGLDGGIAGQSGLKLVWLDDPYKNRQEAESSKGRRTILEGVRSNVFSRLSPRTSVLISHTRWHTDDLIGVLSRDETVKDRFEIIHLKACEDDGTPIVTVGGRDRAFYAQQRAVVSEYDWYSLYQGEPRAREGKLFKTHSAATYDVRPSEMQIAIGVDFAYSARTSADWSTAVVLGRTDHRRYVLGVTRVRCTASDFAGELRGLRLRYPAAPMHAYIGGTELGVVDLLRTQGISITAHTTRSDKHARAIPCAEAWGRGEILLPAQAPWLGAFVGEVADFSGVNDDHDDQVDALVAAFDALGIGTSAARPHDPIILRRPYEAQPSAERAPQTLPRIRKRWE